MITPMQGFILEESAPEATFHLLGEKMRSHSKETPISPLWQDIYSFFAESREWENRLALLKFWVLKEAAAKLSGEGLRGYPNHTNFSLEDPRVRQMEDCLVAVLTDA